jgi:hypothetical protein
VVLPLTKSAANLAMVEQHKDEKEEISTQEENQEDTKEKT